MPAVKTAGRCLRGYFVSVLLGSAIAGVSLAAVPAPFAADLERPAITAKTSSGELRLDGLLDEPAWQEADTTVELVQQSPNPGAPMPFRTIVKVFVTADRLYFGFDCADPEPASISIHTMRRDGTVSGDDTVAVVLDTFGDGRTGYSFRINAAGARIDGLIAGPESTSTNWDGIWDARTAQTATGWSAEIEIPAYTLAFKPGLTAWGMNLERAIARERMVLRWASPTLDAFLGDMSRAGLLEGIGSLRQGLGLEVSPYGVGRTRAFFLENRREWEGDPGLDVTYRVTPRFTAVLTANTDFAETEVDSRQLNITRFPLFFPERRSFFLEGSNQYEFGLGLGSSFIPFFSRRIGLFEGRQIPLLGGAKVNGRVGRWNIGLLDVQTRDTDLAPATNLFAGRLSFDLSSHLRLGAVLTNGNPDGVHENTLAGFDAVWQTSRFLGDKNLLVGTWAAFNSGDQAKSTSSGWGFKVDYPNDLWDAFVSYYDLDEGLDPALGFLPRPGIKRWDVSVEFKPRPSKTGFFKWIRQNFMEHQFYAIANAQGQTESWRFFWAPINVRLESGNRFEFNYVPTFEFLPVPFEISDGVVLPVGKYRFDRFRLEFQTSSHRPWEIGTTSWFGHFYNGRLLQQQNYLRYTSSHGTWQIGLSSAHNYGTLAQGKFEQHLWQLDLVYAFSPNLVLTSFLQYDGESRNIGNNMRLRWTIKPGCDLFVVWNRGWRRLAESPNDLSFTSESELLAVKLRWAFHF